MPSPSRRVPDRRPVPAPRPRWLAAAIAAALAAPLVPALAAPGAGPGPADEDRLQVIGARTQFGMERVRLPGREGMGLAGLTELVSIGGDWWAGGGVYGAASGHRGGLFVPGLAVDWAPVISRSIALDAGLFVGGGGGRSTPVGSGLMLRPHLDLDWKLADGIYTGPTVSWVRFGGRGGFSSTQVGWMIDVADDFRFRFADAPPHERTAFDGGGVASGFGLGRVDAMLTRYQPRRGAVRDDGTRLHGIDLVGLRAEQRLGRDVTAGIEASGAAKGGVAGYAEVLGSLCACVGFGDDDRWELGLRGAVGLGGGGGLQTGGGFIWKADVRAAGRLTESLGVGVSVGVMRAPTGSFSATTVSGSLDWILDPRPGAALASARTEYAGGIERYEAARKDGTRAPISNVVLRLNRFVTPNLYVSAQAHSALAGGAGAYSEGLFGAGVQVPVAGPVRVGAELLAGAAGGGGVDTGSGKLVQGRAYVDVALNRALSLRVGAGRVKSPGAGVNATSVDAELVFRLGVDVGN